VRKLWSEKNVNQEEFGTSQILPEGTDFHKAILGFGESFIACKFSCLQEAEHDKVAGFRAPLSARKMRGQEWLRRAKSCVGLGEFGGSRDQMRIGMTT